MIVVHTAEDSQPKTQSKSSRSLSVTVSSRETPSCGVPEDGGREIENVAPIHRTADTLQKKKKKIKNEPTLWGTYHPFAVHPDVDLPLGGALQDVFGRDAARDLERVEEHVAVEAVPRSLHAWGQMTHAGYR